MMTPERAEHAKLLIAEIEAALAAGTKHYNQAGDLLTTPRLIIECLLTEGAVTFGLEEGNR